MTESVEYSEQEINFIHEMMKQYQEIGHNEFDIATLYTLIINITTALRKNPFPAVQKFLSESDHQARLVAWPSTMPEIFSQDDIIAILPGISDQEYPFFLFITFGAAEFDYAMTQLETDEHANLSNLALTGFPYPPPGSNTSKSLRSPYN